MDNEAAQALALQCVVFILGEDALRDRFLALSGLDGADIKSRVQDTEFLASILEFLISFEPDLIACADALEEKPETLVTAWRALGGGEGQEW